jgi:hypothetical protein
LSPPQASVSSVQRSVSAPSHAPPIEPASAQRPPQAFGVSPTFGLSITPSQSLSWPSHVSGAGGPAAAKQLVPRRSAEQTTVPTRSGQIGSFGLQGSPTVGSSRRRCRRSRRRACTPAGAGWPATASPPSTGRPRR